MERIERRIELPGGKIITITEFTSSEPEVPTPTPPTISPLYLHICPECNQESVFPTAWKEHDKAHWEIHLRCPDCETPQFVIAPQADCDQFDEILDEGREAMIKLYERTVFTNMSEWIEQFVAAIDADHILPSDF